MDAHMIVRLLAEQGISARSAGIHGKPGHRRQVFTISAPITMRLSVPITVGWRTSFCGADSATYDTIVRPAIIAIFDIQEAT